MSFGLKLITILSFIAVGVSMIASLLSTRRFLKGKLREYLLFINLTLLFIFAPYALQVIDSFSRNTESQKDWLISILMLTASFLYVVSSKKLHLFSKVFGFNKRRK